MKFIASLIVAVLLPLSFSTPAEATRPVHGFKYRDVCKNIKGKQTILDVKGATARYEFKMKKNGKYFKRKCVRASWRWR